MFIRTILVSALFLAFSCVSLQANIDTSLNVTSNTTGDTVLLMAQSYEQDRLDELRDRRDDRVDELQDRRDDIVDDYYDDRDCDAADGCYDSCEDDDDDCFDACDDRYPNCEDDCDDDDDCD